MGGWSFLSGVTGQAPSQGMTSQTLVQQGLTGSPSQGVKSQAPSQVIISQDPSQVVTSQAPAAGEDLSFLIGEDDRSREL